MLNPVWAERAVRELEMQRVHYVLWAAKLDYPVDPHRPSTGHIVPLRNYVHTAIGTAKRLLMARSCGKGGSIAKLSGSLFETRTSRSEPR